MPFGSEDGTKFFLAQNFRGAHFTASAGVFVAASLVVSFRDDLGDFDAMTRCINGDEGEVGGGDMAQSLLANVFDHCLDADLHRGTEGTVDAGFEDEKVTDTDGGDEIEVIHGGGDDEGARVAAGGHGADKIHELHQATAEQITEGVAVGREDDFAALGLGCADGTGIGAIRHCSIVIAGDCICRRCEAS